MTLALKEWHVVAEAIARGDQVLTLRKGGIREREFIVQGERLWLFPTWEHETDTDVKRVWHGELTRSRKERRSDGRIPIRCHCEVVESWEVRDPSALAAIEQLHLWTPAYAESRLRWRPTKPLQALLLRASALVEPYLLDPDERYVGCRSWVELTAAPSPDDLICSLTDDAFGLFAEAVREALGSGVGASA